MIFSSWLEAVNCAILKSTKGKESRTYNCREGPSFLAAVSVCVRKVVLGQQGIQCQES